MNTRSKSTKPEDGEEGKNGDEKSGVLIPLILVIKETSHLENVIGREFEQKLGEHFKIDVPFARIGKFDGEIVLDRDNTDASVITKLLTEGWEYNGKKVVFEAADSRANKEFMRNHGRHVGRIVQKSKIFA